MSLLGLAGSGGTRVTGGSELTHGADLDTLSAISEENSHSVKVNKLCIMRLGRRISLCLLVLFDNMCVCNLKQCSDNFLRYFFVFTEKDLQRSNGIHVAESCIPSLQQ